jgi:hypothetical protein
VGCMAQPRSSSALPTRIAITRGKSLSPENSRRGIAAHRAIRTNDVIAWRTRGRSARVTLTGAEIVRPSDVGVLSQAPDRDLTL